jgi:ribosome maturation factor RimP
MPSLDRDRLEKLIEPVLRDGGYELVDLEHQREAHGWVLRLFIDRAAAEATSAPQGLGEAVPAGWAHQGGVGVDDCARVSRDVSALLDVEDPFDHPYTLEVSSPGLNRPLRRERDFARFQGERAKIRLRDPIDGRKNFAGVLRGAEGGRVGIDVDGRTFSLPLDAIQKAHLEYDFSKPRTSPKARSAKGATEGESHGQEH